MNAILTARYAGESRVYQINEKEYTFGRANYADLRVPSHWITVSGVQLRIRRDSDGRIFVIDGYNGKPSTNRTTIGRRNVSHQSWSSWPSDLEMRIGSSINSSVNLEWHLDRTNAPECEISNTSIVIGRSSNSDIQIEGPTISRIHCIIRNSGQVKIIEDKSTNGTYVNDQRISRPTPLREGDQIKVGTHIFLWTSRGLKKETSGRDYRIDIRNLWLPGRISGSSLSIEPGQLVAFVGGSGAGKSSLLTTIVGQNMDYKGDILINGSQLRHCYSSIKQEIGFVPQDDIVHKDLTVEEVLRYSARLKLPDVEQQREGVERVLEALELQHRRSARVKDLSGGQRKRVSIGVELIADPRILFLDEPTSGLDPGLDKRMMQLLRRLADNGKTVALVTHATNNVMLCDQVVFLGRGGYLCYAGPPDKCGSYFGLDGDFADIYQYLEKSDDEIKQISSEFNRTHLEYLPQLVSSNNHQRQFCGLDLALRARDLPSQLKTLLSRDIRLQTRDATSLVLNAITAPLAAVMIAIAANNRTIFQNYSNLGDTQYPDALRILFVVVCSAIWVGLSTSLQTVVKERSIFIRERAFNLLPEAYLLSKFLIMLFQAFVQSLLVALSVIFLFASPHDIDQWFIGLVSIFFATLVAIGSQALFVSSIVSNGQQASSAAPLLLIPQLVFGGVLFNLGDSAKDVYALITSRWSMRALGSITEITKLIPGGKMGINSIAGASAYDPGWHTRIGAFQVLSVQTSILVVATLAALLFYKRNRSY